MILTKEPIGDYCNFEIKEMRNHLSIYAQFKAYLLER